MTDILKIINELGINKQFLPIIYCLLLLGALYKPLKYFGVILVEVGLII